MSGRIAVATRSNSVRIAAAVALAVVAVLSVAISSPRAAGTFAPTISIETSTSRATAHPDARITIDNTASDENIKDLSMSLPDGFWGSLGAIPRADRCVDPWSGCDAAAKIGTVTATALITDPDTDTEADGVLQGDIFLTEDILGFGDPAGVAIVVQAKVGGVDLGPVIVPARAKVRTALLTGWSPSAAPTVVGLDTIANDIPQDIYDFANDRYVTYKVEKMQIDLISDLKASEDAEYLPPLLTNPARCGTYELSMDATSYDSSNASDSADYVVDQCDTVRLDPAVTNEFTDGTIPASSAQGLVTNISLPTVAGQPVSNGTMQRIRLQLPRGMGANLSAFGDTADMCNGGSLSQVGSLGDPNTTFYFEPNSCKGGGIDSVPQAKVGVATIKTPLLPPDEELIGEIYAVNKTPIPGLAIYVREPALGGPSTNPAGINTAMATIPNIVPYDSVCGSGCGTRIIADFTALPDVPISEINVDLDEPARPRLPNPPLSGRILRQADPDETCQATNDIGMDFWSSVSGSPIPVVTTTATSGCPAPKVTPTTGPWGQVTDDASPEFAFTYSGAGTVRTCGIDLLSSGASDCTASSEFAGSSLSQGTHNLLVSDDSAAPTNDSLGSGGIVRYTGVKENVTYDNTVPTTTITADPGATTPDSTPSFTFNASETSAFQCSLDGGAFLPCGEATGTGSVSYEIPAAEALEASDATHTFRVRAQDDAGNVDLSPDEVEFKIVKPFAPTVDVDLSTTQGRAHPTMTVTIANQSHEDIEDLALNMPDGFFGGITGVQSLCSIAAADAGTCGAGSQVGTVKATAVIDRSTARISGKVFLTDPRHAGDPAGLTIQVNPKLQQVTFDPITINSRLSVRGQAQGINTLTLDIPNTTTSTVGEVSEFDIRVMELKLQDNPSAPQPLLTNPSGCGNRNFEADFTGYADTQSSADSTVTFTGCENLGFAPQVSLSVTKPGGGAPEASDQGVPVEANLDATVTANPGDAGIKDVDVLMPKPVTINVQKIPFSCTIEAQALDACPPTSKIGTVSAISPLLPEPLNGEIYLFKPVPGDTSATLPRLFLRLRGRINVDLFAVNKFFNTIQLRSTFTNLPDVPLSSFTMHLDGFLSTRPEACSYSTAERNATGTMVGHNGKTAGILNYVDVNCPTAPTTKSSFKFAGKKGSKSRFTTTTTATPGKKIKKLTLTLPRGFKFNTKSLKNKKRLAKLIIVKGGNKKLSTKCFRLRSATRLEVNLCKKQYDKVTIQTKAGALAAAKKTKKPAFKTVVVDSSNSTVTSQ